MVCALTFCVHTLGACVGVVSGVVEYVFDSKSNFLT